MPVTSKGSTAILLGAGVALALAAGAPAADQAPLSVSFSAAMVEERKEVDDATKNALKKKKDDAGKARKALEKQLKDQLGKKRESWPPEKDEELYRLEEAEAVAEAEYEYRKIEVKAIGDAVEDVTRAAQGKGMQAGKKDRIAVVGSLAEADLAVSILARRSQKQLGAVVPSDCWVLFSVGPGGKLPPERFAKVPVTYRARKFGLYAWKIASPSKEKPVFVFEGWNGGQSSIGCHGGAANAASGLIDKFIEDNYAALTGK